MSNALDQLPLEMQQRIASIVNANQKQIPESPHQAAIAQPQRQPEPQKNPTLMDHTIALRQEVAALRQQVAAMGQVTDAVGQAVGQLYGMFQQQTEVTNFSENFQTETPVDGDY